MIEPAKMWNKNYICIITANFMLSMGHSSVNPLVATYTKYLNTSAQMTGFLTGMFFMVSFACHPFAGPVMTKLDKRKVLAAVYLLGAIANVGYALFHSVPVFIAFRFLSGVQYSLVGPLLFALSGDHLPPEKLAYGLGIFGVGSAIGNAIAPAVGEAILNFGTALRGDSFGFSLLFLFGAVIFILATIPSILIDPDKKTKEDIASTGAWYKNIISVHCLPTAVTMLLIITSYATINAYIFEFSKEQGIQGASMFFLVHAVALAVSRPLSGFFTTKIGVTGIIFPALVIFAISLLTIGFSGALWMVILGAVLAAIGFGASQPSIQAMGIQSEPALRRGVASNTIYMGIDMGWFLGPFLGGLVYAKTDYPTMFKLSVVPVCLSIVCLALALPLLKRRISKLRNGDQ